jgi:hypothetical protein
VTVTFSRTAPLNCLGGWVDGWISGCMDGCIDKERDGSVDLSVDEVTGCGMKISTPLYHFMACC